MVETRIDATSARGRRRPGQSQDPGRRPGRPADGMPAAGMPAVRTAPSRTAARPTESHLTATKRPAAQRAVPPRGVPPRGVPPRGVPPRTIPKRTATQRTATQRIVPQRTAAERAEQAWTGGAVSLPRMPFVLLVLALLGGGLICLLVINTTLGATSFRITQLQSTNASLSQQHQALQQAIANEGAPGQIARRAYALGMRWQSQLNFLNSATGRIYQVGARGLGTVNPLVPSSAANSVRAATPNGRAKSGGSTRAGGKPAAGSSGSGSAGRTGTGSRHRGTRRPRPKASAGSAT